MEALAFVEELGRHGDVVRRHALQRLPARIGRGYCADVIVDDPYVAAEHLEIRLASDGALEAVDLGSLNGTLRRGDAVRISVVKILGDDILHIGQTQIRVCLPEKVVATELPLVRHSWNRHPATFFLAAGLLVALTLWTGYVATFDTDTSNIFVVPIMASFAVLIWAAVWSLVCRILHGNSNFWAHGIVAFLGSMALLAGDTLTEYFFYSFDLRGLEFGWRSCLAALFAVILYHHLRLTARLSPRIVAAATVVSVAVLFAGVQTYQTVRDGNKPGLQSFDKTIKPSALLFAQGIAPAPFIGIAEKLKDEADREALAMEK